LLLGVVLLVACPASAQDAKQAAAIAAFDDAQALMEKGQIGAACVKYGQRYKLDPQLGTLLHWADCLEQEGKFASSWTTFREAAELAHKKGDARQSIAEERAAALRPRLSTLELELPPDLPDGARISRGGTLIDEDLWSIATPVDPGTYELEVSAPGYTTWRGQAVVAGEGQVVRVPIPALISKRENAQEAAPLASGTPEPAATSQVVDDGDKERPNKGLFAAKWPAFVAGGVGLAGAAVWTVFGVQSIQAKKNADTVCDGPACQTEQGRAWRNDAYLAGNLATVGAIVTGVGVASATVLWIVLPSPAAKEYGSSPSKSLEVGVGPAAFSVKGAW